MKEETVVQQILKNHLRLYIIDTSIILSKDRFTEPDPIIYPAPSMRDLNVKEHTVRGFYTKYDAFMYAKDLIDPPYYSHKLTGSPQAKDGCLSDAYDEIESGTAEVLEIGKRIPLIYEVIDLRNDSKDLKFSKTALYENTSTNSFGIHLVDNTRLHIIAVHPVTVNDTCQLISHRKYEFTHDYTPVEFIPKPSFPPPKTSFQTKNNIDLYLAYRTGSERENIQHLRKFLFLKGYSLDEKRDAALRLKTQLEHHNNNQLTKEEIKILKNGTLGRATKGFSRF